MCANNLAAGAGTASFYYNGRVFCQQLDVHGHSSLLLKMQSLTGSDIFCAD